MSSTPTPKKSLKRNKHSRAQTEQTDGSSSIASFKPQLTTNNSKVKLEKRGPTLKEKQMRKDIEILRKRLNEKDSTIKSLKTETNMLQKKVNVFEEKNKQKNQKLETEVKMRLTANQERIQIKNRLRKMQNAVNARLKLLGIDLSNCNSIGEALDASLAAIIRLVGELQLKEEELLKVAEENAKLKASLEKANNKISKLENKIAKQNETIEKQKSKLAEFQNQIDRLNNANSQLTRKRDQLMKELQEWKDKHNKLEKESKKEIKTLKTNLNEKETENQKKDNLIEKLRQEISELKNENASQKQTIEKRDKEVSKLNSILKERDETIVTLETKVKELEKEIERLLAIINRPKSEKGTQTKITGPIEDQLMAYPNLKQKVEELTKLLEAANKRIEALEEENKMLLMDIQELIKAACRFYPDTSNHAGQVLQIRANPSKFTAATSAFDKTIRLWKIDPSLPKKKQCQPYARSNVDAKVEALAFSKDGLLLAGGTGFRDGPDGYLLVWDMSPTNEGTVLHAFRSRPTVRFGRVTTTNFSENKKAVFAGDTTGSIWIFNIETDKMVGCISSHNDVVHSIFVRQNLLYSAGHDKVLYVIDTSVIDFNISIAIPDITETLRAMKGGKPERKKSSAKIFSKSPRSSNTTPRGSTKQRSSRKVVSGRSKSKTRTQSSRKLKAIAVQAISPNVTEETKTDYEEIEGLRHYKGKKIASDERYPFWCVCVTSDGRFVVTGSRKVYVYQTEDGITCAPFKVKFQDSDNDHIRSIATKSGLMLVARTGCPRSKLFNIKNGGKEVMKFGGKGGFIGADFCFDNKHIVAGTQELIPNEAPKTFFMKLFNYKEES